MFRQFASKVFTKLPINKPCPKTLADEIPLTYGRIFYHGVIKSALLAGVGVSMYQEGKSQAEFRANHTGFDEGRKSVQQNESSSFRP